ncbi:Type I secretion system membrane fusion protein PrsE [Serratia fonticola]|uniref:Membrane fusion protein (MFP) family protein n=1 Tax=Serratia fonticola TaxID=47917 RepID=A0A0F7H797_SERFO|nr:HlyD family type I secretion periplasmic adaptor subunit [Serratia fonticola]AKG67688.1 hemolysin secretion protein D [Serratia fonticola]CAI1819460.1 Type I secretion system membrane fusion protein PrsE [Serratia fonticola]VTR32814.1 Type I secretion system membrane fusion protein PrsE [Serratia fonticola]
MFNKLRSRFKRAPKPAPLQAGDAAFMSDLRESLLIQSAPGSRAVLYIICIIMATGITWAHYAEVEEITQGEGKIISKSREQVIESLEGGIIEEMLVREGDIVEKGQPLLKIDPTRASSTYQEMNAKLMGLKAMMARLEAEAYQKPLKYPEELQKYPLMMEQETKAYESRKKSLEDSLNALQRSRDLILKEISMTAPLAARGLISEVELLRMRRQANDLDIQIVERRNRYQGEANAELTKAELEVAQLIEGQVGRKDVLTRTTIYAPVYGTVKNVTISTIGGVIQPGGDIMEIVPLEDQLIVEGQIKPQDVAFLRPGLPATVKVSAYDYGIYGGLKGTVVHISPDTLQDEKKLAAGRPDAIYYRVQILTDTSWLESSGKKLPIIPGMTATVEIRTGTKTILDYLLKPVFKAREAFRER